MQCYRMTVVEPSTGPRLAHAELYQTMKAVYALHQQMHDADVWVLGSTLHPPATATTLRPQGDEVLLTDGPFIEGKEHVGGVSVISVPDLDAALEWGRKMVRATPIPIEGRPFYDGAG